MIRYNKLFALLAMRGMMKKDLLTIVSSPVVAKLGKNEGVSIDTIDKICELLDCQPGDIMEYVPEKKDRK